MQPRYVSNPQPAVQNFSPSHLHPQHQSQQQQQEQSQQSQQSLPQAMPQSVIDELSRVFNTAVVASQAETKRDFSSELCQITQSAPFKAILSAVRHLSRVQGISEKQAAESVIQTFRKMDEIWKQYLYREGLERLRNQRR